MPGHDRFQSTAVQSQCSSVEPALTAGIVLVQHRDLRRDGESIRGPMQSDASDLGDYGGRLASALYPVHLPVFSVLSQYGDEHRVGPLVIIGPVLEQKTVDVDVLFTPDRA